MNIIKYIKQRNFGLLLLRLGIGTTMMMHGVPKLLKGASSLESLGQAMAVVGITFFPVFWGLMAALAEALGGLLLILGYKTRIAAASLSFMMLMGVLSKVATGAPFPQYAWPLELMILFTALIFIGAGRFSLDRD